MDENVMGDRDPGAIGPMHPAIKANLPARGTPLFLHEWEPPEGRAGLSLDPMLLAHRRCSVNAGGGHGGSILTLSLPPWAHLDKSLSLSQTCFSI